MSDEIEISRCETSKEKIHHHRGKSSESLLNKELILKALNIQAGHTILDAGCGNGYMAKVFSSKVTQSGKVYAIDPDAEAIEALRIETQGTNIEAIEGDITKPIPLNQSSVDLIYVSQPVDVGNINRTQGYNYNLFPQRKLIAQWSNLETIVFCCDRRIADLPG